MEDNLLTTEQVLLLENLTYLLDNEGLSSLETIVEKYAVDGKEDVSVSDVIAQIAEDLEDDEDYGSYITGKDWENIIQAIKNDETLCKMKVMEVHGDAAKSKEEAEKEKIDLMDFGMEEEDYEGAISALFVNEATGEAVVAFRGTVNYEWDDNFYGGAMTGASDRVSTEYQEKALEWYRSLNLEEAGYETITVTGHSKGGNKAKYITVMDESVDRCISFDGQGFSDEFLVKYEEEIGKRAYKISNHNVEYDFVNLLLNDIGEITYYKGYDYGEGGLLEAHCPNTFFTYDSKGNAHMTPVEGQAVEMKVMNEFLNTYLRTLLPIQRRKAMETIGGLIATQQEKMSPIKYIDILERRGGKYVILDLLRYSMIYETFNPELSASIQTLIFKFFVVPFFHLEELGLSEEMQKFITEKIVDILGQGIMFYAYDIGLGWLGLDLQVASRYTPLEKTRVFDISKLELLGNKGKQLLDTGYLSCSTWDSAVSGLKTVQEYLPSKIRSSALTDSLSGLVTPFTKEEYGTMGTYINNTISAIVTDIVTLDEEAATAIDDITESLSGNIATIKELSEGLVMTPS